MKKYFFRIGMCLTTILLLFGLFSVSAESTIYRMNVYQKDGQKIQFEVSGIDSIQFDTVCVEKGYEYIDLGLPSGLKWATRNVGASSPEDEEGNEDFNYAHYLSFYSDLVRVSYYNRCNGFTIRGVWQKKESESEGGSEE